VPFGCTPDAVEAGEKVEGAFKPGVVGFGLVGPECLFGVIVNLDKVVFRSL
jgi:hypothetical protein